MISELLTPRSDGCVHFNKDVTCYVNGKPFDYGKSGVSISLEATSMTMYHLLQAAGKRLQIHARRVFNQEGRELDEVALIQSGDALFFSEGENFCKPPPQNQNSAQAKQRSIYDNYELLKQLGQGSFGMVFYSKHVLTHKEAALKFITKSYTPKFTDNIFSEIHCLEKLKHNHIIHLNGVINAKDHMILVMEYAKGGDLKDYIMERHEVNEEVVCKIFNQVIDAIRYCHKQRILHHDLKLQNILLMRKITSIKPLDKTAEKTHAQDVCVKIADFGLSTTFKDDTNFKGGSLAYLSPEVLNKTRDYEPTVRDVWSLGVILFALCTGHLPWGKGTSEEIKKKILKYDGSKQHLQRALSKIQKKREKKLRKGVQESEESGSVGEVKKLPGSGGTDEILAGDNAMRSVEPPFLMNDAIVDLLTKILRPSWIDRATVLTISQHDWISKFDKHTRATTRSPKRSSPKQLLFKQRISRSPRSLDVSNNRGFAPPRVELSSITDSNTETSATSAKMSFPNSKQTRNVCTSPYHVDTTDAPVGKGSGAGDSSFGNKERKSNLAARRSLNVPTIATKRTSPYTVCSPRSGNRVSAANNGAGNRHAFRRYKSLPDLFKSNRAAAKSSQKKLENTLAEWECKKNEATTPTKLNF